MVRKWGLAALLVLLAVAGGAAGGGWLLLRGSLPRLDGRARLEGLSASAALARDSLGTVTVSAESRNDAVRVLGFAHAQDRFFEMDLLRRTAAGELSALVGRAALPLDQSRRVHRFRARMPDHLAALPAEDQALLAAYAEGVNAGLDGLAVRPWPYLLLRVKPRRWLPEDALLAGLAMFFDLQDGQNDRELLLLELERRLPPRLFFALAAPGTALDAPLVGEPWPPLDSAAIADELARFDFGEGDAIEPKTPGSNNFGVSGQLTADGRAIVANDMHLGLRAPGLWYRARLIYPDPEAPGGRVDATGVSLPGVPALVVGTNGHVAWGFTNSNGDWLDWVELADEAAAGIRVARERIEVKGEPDEVLEVEESRWGPVLGRSPEGRPLALAWTAHRPGAIDLGLIRLLRAMDLDEAVAIAHGSGIPVQNAVFADSTGRLGWTLMGRLPEREGGCDPQRPLVLGCRWTDRFLPSERVPLVLDPPDGRIQTANSRVVDAAGLAVVGDGGYALGARQRQIRDQLREKQRFTETDLLAIQLDDRALLLRDWWVRLRRTVEGKDEFRALEEVTRAPPERASVDSVSYRAARELRLRVHGRVRTALGGRRAGRLAQLEPVVIALLDGDRGPAVLESATRTLIAEWESKGPSLAERTWGEANTARICHPLAAALPEWLSPRLCMPKTPLPGDDHVPRVQGPSFGASERMVVSPGREEDGILHVPSGPSGHPLSRFWGAGHGDWETGRPTPLLPGAPQHHLQLEP